MNDHNVHYALFLKDGLIAFSNHPNEKHLNQFSEGRYYRVPEGVMIPLTATAIFAYIRLSLDRYRSEASIARYRWVMNPAILEATGPFAYAIVRMDRFLEVVQGYFCPEERKLKYNRSLVELSKGVMYATVGSIAEPCVDQMAQTALLVADSPNKAYDYFNTAYPMGNSYTMVSTAGIDSSFSQDDFMTFAELGADNDLMCDAIFDLFKKLSGGEHHHTVSGEYSKVLRYLTEPTATELRLQDEESKRARATKARATREANKARKAAQGDLKEPAPTKVPPAPTKVRKRAVRKSETTPTEQKEVK